MQESLDLECRAEGFGIIPGILRAHSGPKGQAGHRPHGILIIVTNPYILLALGAVIALLFC